MTPSALQIARETPPLHVAVIMDGNGRWAAARGLPRSAGHRRGAEAVRRVVEAAPPLGIATLTLYAFSSDNWQRPTREVSALMRLFRAYLRAETPKLAERGVRLSVIGRRDRLALPLRDAIARAECDTAAGTALHLRLAIDYSARDAITRAARLLAAAPPNSASDGDAAHGEFASLLARACAPADSGADSEARPLPTPDVDLLIRTGGERRLSDFLLWECAYAELYFTTIMWPDFAAADLAAAVADFHARDRRFGALPHLKAAGDVP